MTDTISSTPTPDWPVLGAWLQAHADGFHGLRHAERIVGGNSNPIWLLSADSGRYVLRTQPAGVLLKSATPWTAKCVCCRPCLPTRTCRWRVCGPPATTPASSASAST